MDLPHALQFDELAEDQGKRLPHAEVWVPVDLIGSVADITNRDCREQFAAPSLLFERFMGALTQDGQLHLAHRSLHAKQQPIVCKTGIVDAVLIGDQRPDEAAELQQRVPVPSIAGQARSLDRHHRADPAFADRRQKLLEPGATDA